MSRSRRISRRAILGGAAATLAATGGLEYLSLTGRFDHRKIVTPPPGARFAASLATLDPQANALVHIGHSTHLLVVDGVRFLTDPWFYDPAFGALSHELAPATRPGELGALDAIVVTHDHADHADLRAMDEMDKRAVVVVATRELAARVRALGFSDVSVLAPWEERRIGRVMVSAVPALHDIYEIGVVIRGAHKSVYFAGDTRLHPGIAEIAERFRPRASILPVDGTRLRGGQLHVMTPEDAVTAATTLGSALVVPSHAEAVFTDPFAEHVVASTVPHARTRFEEQLRRALPQVRCVVPEPGARVEL